MDEELKVKVTIDAESANKSIDKLNEGLDKVNQKIDSTNKKSLNGLQKATIDTSGLGLEQLKSVQETLKASNIDSTVLKDINNQISNISTKIDAGSGKKGSSSSPEKGGKINWGKIGAALFGVKEVLDLVKKLFSDNANMQASLNNLFTTLGSILAPIINFIARVVNTIAVILSNLFKINKKTSVNTGAMARTLAGFDEINNIGVSSGAGTNTDNVNPGVFQWAVDLFEYIKDELGQWLIIIGSIALIIGAAINAVPLAIAGIITLLAGAWLLIKENWGSLKAYFVELGHNLKVVFWDMPKALLDSLISAIISVGVGIKELFIALWNDFIALGGWISSAWTNIKTTIGNVWVIFKEYWVNTWNSIKNFASTSVQSIKNSWEGLKNSVSNIVSSIGKSIKDAVWNNGLRRVIQALANGVVNLVNKIPLVNVGYPTIPYLAKGGIVNEGQLFIANEAGPELVGRYGSRTGVMNNEQIVEAVANGVYNAVIDAGKENNQEIILNIDGVRLAKSVVKNINMMNRIAGGSVIG